MNDTAATPSPAPSLLDLPAAVAIARVAGERLDDADAALRRLADARDTEALHDFRVAVRRTRSLLRAWRPWLGRAASRKMRRRLRDLGDATNAGRDAEVQLSWIEAARPQLARGERTGLNWIARRLRATRRAEYAAARRRVRSDFARVAAALEERLAGVPVDGAPLGPAFGVLVRDHADALARNAASIGSADDRRAVHEARIAGKRLRYLLEPLRAGPGPARALVKSMKGLQDALGELHDLHVLEGTLETALAEASAEKARALRDAALAGDDARLRREHRRDERLGLVALAALARRRRDEVFAALDASWLRGGLAALVADAHALSASLAAPSPSPVPAAASPQAAGPPLEIERKYLLSALPDRVRSAPSREIQQGWLPGQLLRERLRRVRDDRGERFYRTIKTGAGLARVEIEEETTAAVFHAMWPLTEGCRISKRRYIVHEGDLAWEVDDFDDRELVMAEVELASTDQEVPIPAWLQAVLVREVTDDGAYTNLALATASA